MKMNRMLLLSALAAVSLVAADKINGAGASFPAPIYYKWAHDYQAQTGVQVNYQSIGSGGGIKQIEARTVDFGASDEPLEAKRLGESKLLQFPAVVGAICLAYNLPELEGKEVKLSNAVVEEIFLGTITKWNDPKIAADNAGVALPDKTITIAYRSDGSGTTWNFTYWLDKMGKTWHEKVGLGKTVQWPVGIGGKGNEGVTNMIKQTPGSIGYIETAYAAKNNLPMATLQSAEGTWVKATTENIMAAAANAKWKGEEGFYQILASQPGKTTYPIVAATFILLPQEKAAENKEVSKFFTFAFEKGAEEAEKLGYIPLPKPTVEAIEAYLKTNGAK